MSLRAIKPTPLGEILVNQEGMPPSYLKDALAEQKRCHSLLGDVLVAQGKVNHLSLYKALAKQHGLDFVNLKRRPANLSLLRADAREDYIQRGYIPYPAAGAGSETIIATTSLSAEFHEEMRQVYPGCRCVVTSPEDIVFTVERAFSDVNSDEACNRLYRENKLLSARHVFSSTVPFLKLKYIMALAIIATAAAMCVPSVFMAMNLFFAMTLAFKAVVFFLGAANDPLPEETAAVFTESEDLPVYTLLIPLFKERREVVDNLIAAIRALDYPKSKLDVKLIVEAADEETIGYITDLRCERIFDIIRIPFSQPQTKPKALNYALLYARGSYVTIYDAEDRPSPGQLKEAVAVFTRETPDVVCLQSRLNYYNRHENILTRLFSLEYSCWFDFQLLGLQTLEFPIPLGGTSNHFRIAALKELMAWDPYNVTEDADLGIRLAAKGYKTRVLHSETLEEAPVTLGNWIRQRSRWIKGHLQTYLVHTSSGELYSRLGFKNFFGFVFFIGAPCMVFITLPFVLAAAIAFWTTGMELPPWFHTFAVYNFFAAVGVHALFALAVCVKRRWWGMMPYCLVFPLYWALHSLAAFRAVWQLVTRPFYWEKTSHGESQMIKTAKTPMLS